MATILRMIKRGGAWLKPGSGPLQCGSDLNVLRADFVNENVGASVKLFF